MRKGSIFFNLWVQFFSILGILIFINLISIDYFLRGDLTETKSYTLSEPSIKIMKELDAPLYARVYFSKNLQAPFNEHRRVLRDKLEEYRAFSNNKMEVILKDPTGNKEVEEESKRFGVHPVKFNYRGKEKLEIKMVHMGVSFLYRDRQEVLSPVKDLNTLEYDITRALRKLIKEEGEERKTLGILTGHGEFDLSRMSKGFERIRNRLSENYRLKDVDLSLWNISEDLDLLLVLGPQQMLSERDLYILDQLLMRGVKAGFFISTMAPNLMMMKSNPIVTGLENFLAHYGVRLMSDVVIDREQNGVIRIPVFQGRLMLNLPVNYPLVPLITDLPKENPIFSGVDKVPLPFVSSLEIVSEGDRKGSGDFTATELLESSGTSTRIKGGPPSLDPQQLKIRLPMEEDGPFTVAVSLEGKFLSYFKGRDKPEAELEPAIKEGDEGGEVEEPEFIEDSPETRMIVIGSTGILMSNPLLFINMVDWLAEDEELMALRGKSVSLPPLKNISRGMKLFVKFLNIAGIPLLFILFGLIRWKIKRMG